LPRRPTPNRYAQALHSGDFPPGAGPPLAEKGRAPHPIVNVYILSKYFYCQATYSKFLKLVPAGGSASLSRHIKKQHLAILFIYVPRRGLEEAEAPHPIVNVWFYFQIFLLPSAVLILSLTGSNRRF
jgi:hypothetical protein